MAFVEGFDWNDKRARLCKRHGQLFFATALAAMFMNKARLRS